jgi:DNA-binding IclR family transcriptional regulator
MSTLRQDETGSKRGTGVGVLDRSVTLLDLLADGPRTLRWLSDASALPRPTAYRLLVALEAHRLVARDATGAFRLGPRLTELAVRAGPAVDLAALAGPVLTRLHEATGESAQLYVRSGDRRLCIAARDAGTGLRDSVAVGALLPLDAGSGGTVLRAWSQPSEAAGGGPGGPAGDRPNDAARGGPGGPAGDRPNDAARGGPGGPAGDRPNDAARGGPGGPVGGGPGGATGRPASREAADAPGGGVSRPAGRGPGSVTGGEPGRTARGAADLAAVRKRGWAASVAEREPGVASVSAPVLAGGALLGALCISGPASRIGTAPGKRLAPMIVEAAAELAALATAS